jgi:hypothetical protein
LRRAIELKQVKSRSTVESAFFIPIVTPRAVASKHCKFEFESFLARERALGRDDLIFPILYLSVPALLDEANWRDDPVLSIVGRRQHIDWRRFRHVAPETTVYGEAIETLGEQIVGKLRQPWVSPEERRQLEAEAARRAEEEERARREAEAKRHVEEREQNRREALAKQRAEKLAREREQAEVKRRAEEGGGGKASARCPGETASRTTIQARDQIESTYGNAGKPKVENSKESGRNCHDSNLFYCVGDNVHYTSFLGGFLGGFVGGFLSGFLGRFLGGFLSGFLGRFLGGFPGGFAGGFVGGFLGGFVGRFLSGFPGGFLGGLSPTSRS